MKVSKIINMKIAVVTITYNDDYKLYEWFKWFQKYKAECGLHIIVDNGSDIEYQHKVKGCFQNSVFLELGHNGGCTEAYNIGIKYALQDPTVTHIALIGNDIRLESNSLSKCVLKLNSDNHLCMVAPVLFEANSNIIADLGCQISKYLTMIPYGLGLDIKNVAIEDRYCEAVTGGMNISKRNFYETVGLQDENLFMYSDEVDIGIRAAKQGLKLAVVYDSYSWHQHINPPCSTRRLPFSQYLIGRNKVYLAQKHFGLSRAFKVWFFFFRKCIKNVIKGCLKRDRYLIRDATWQFIGICNGLTGNMTPNKYSSIK